MTDQAMTGHDLDRLRLLDTLAVGDGQHWPDLYSNPEQQRIAEVMYGAQADELLASSWLADRERDLRAKLAAAEQERDDLQAQRDAQTEWPTEDGWLRDQHARYHDEPGNMLGPDECGWSGCQFWDAAIWVTNAPQRAATEQDEPKRNGYDVYVEQLEKVNPELAAQDRVLLADKLTDPKQEQS